ncbi:hypothetical protein [uncultured Enterococcus sp.]|uniref:hypothetical protein n=1 Tax=uncultured Enterococcus sp. TaxID=167972 RepID=UPI00259305B3|nr:hypothetical protein [uncultured Enterococcus sp.]
MKRTKKQNLGDLNGYLFETLEALTNPDMCKEELEIEMERARTIATVAGKIISAGELVLRTERVYERNQVINPKVPDMLEGNFVDIDED